MKIIKSLTLLLCLTNICCKSFEGSIKKHDSDLYIGVYDCFENDSIKIMINNNEIISINNLTSDLSTGVTGLYIEYYFESTNKGLVRINNKKMIIEKEIYIDLKKDILLEIIRNNNVDKFKLQLNKGKKIGISGCSDDRKNTLITYFQKNILLE